MDIKEDLIESDGTEEKNQPQTDDEQSSYEDSVKRTSPLKSINVDEKFAVSSIVGKSTSHKENYLQLYLINNLASLWKRYCRKRRRKMVKEAAAVPRVCFVARMGENVHDWLTHLTMTLCIAFHEYPSLIKCLGKKVDGEINVMPSLKQVFQIGRNSANTFRYMKNPNPSLIQG